MIDWLHSLMPGTPIERIWSIILTPIAIFVAALLLDKRGGSADSKRGAKKPNPRL